MTRSTHELRISSLGEGAFSYTAGLFWNEFENDFALNYVRPHQAPSLQVDSPGIDGTNLFFKTEQMRTDTQTAVFGELSYAFNDQWSALVGARYYEYEGQSQGIVTFGPNRTLFIVEGIADFKTSSDDVLTKFNLTWRPTDDLMWYFTRAEGYRPGGVNRDPVLFPLGFGTFDQDFLTSYEIGWKSTSADGRWRFNGAIYTSDWEDVQYTIYNFSLSKCCGSTYNLGDAEVTGFEMDITWAASDHWTWYGSLAKTDAKTSEDFVLDPGGDDEDLVVPKGQVLPNVPQFKYNVTGRYAFTAGGHDAYAQLNYSYVSSTTNRIVPTDPQFADQDDYQILNFRAGVALGTWNVDVFVNNMTDEIADIAVNSRVYGSSTIINRPRTIGLKVGKSF